MPRPDKSTFGYGSGKPSSPPPEPIADAIGMQPPARVRYGADRWIDQEVIEAAKREWRAKGKRIRRIKVVLDPPKRQIRTAGIDLDRKGFKKAGYHEVDLAEDEQLAKSGI